MNLDREAMAQRCPDAVCDGMGFLAGHAFCINGKGVATVVPRTEASVWGLLWRLRRSVEERPDRFEGVAGGLHTKERLGIGCRRGVTSMRLCGAGSTCRTLSSPPLRRDADSRAAPAMSPLAIRPATPADGPALLALQRRSLAPAIDVSARVAFTLP